MVEEELDQELAEWLSEELGGEPEEYLSKD
jgi:hypothetical protein